MIYSIIRTATGLLKPTNERGATSLSVALCYHRAVWLLLSLAMRRGLLASAQIQEDEKLCGGHLVFWTKPAQQWPNISQPNRVYERPFSPMGA